MPLPLAAVLEGLPDPRRQTKNKLHGLNILTIATCAVIGGAEPWEAIPEYGRAKEAFFRRFLRLEHGVPSPDTFERVFATLAPGRSPGRWAAGWRRRAKAPVSSRSPSTGRRPGGRSGTQRPGA